MAAIFLLFAACSPQNVRLPAEKSTQTSTPVPAPTSQPQPTSTLNSIQQAIATQSASQKSQAITARTDIPMPEDSLVVSSPDGRIEVLFGLLEGVPYYSINRDGKPVLLPSRLGLTFLKDPPLNADLSIVDSERSTFDETWTQPWGEVKSIGDYHNELRVELSDGSSTPRQLAVVFRLLFSCVSLFIVFYALISN